MYFKPQVVSNTRTKPHQFPVMELFGPTIQGEGILTGTISHFLRTGGCGLRCTWCDSMYSVLPHLIKEHRTMMTSEDIILSLEAMPWAPYLTLTGGDPCLQKHLDEIFPYVNGTGTKIAVETQGELFPDWLMDTDVITFSPKPPSSGNTVNVGPLIDWLSDAIDQYMGLVCIKIVCFDEDDFKYALEVYKAMHESMYDSFYFTAGSPDFVYGQPAQDRIMGIMTNYQWLAAQVLKNVRANEFHEKVHVGAQLHAMIWPHTDKGV